MPTIPLPEPEEPNPHAEQAREIVRRATRTVGIPEKSPVFPLVALAVLAIIACMNPNPLAVDVAVVATIILSITLVARR